MELMALSTKVCSKCGRELPDSEFYPHRRACKSCESLRKKEWHKKNSERLSKKYKERYYKNKEAVAEYGREYRKNRREHHWFEHFSCNKSRDCRARDIPYDLDPEYLASIWVDVCPVLGIPLIDGSKLIGCSRPDNLAELDRLIPDKGYVKGNVHWISRRANRIKSDATVEELERIISYMKDNDGE